MITISQPARLRKGPGNGSPSDGLCLMQMVDWFSGSDHTTDHPKCASRILGELAMFLNDSAPSQEVRDSLWPLTWLLLDSVDPGREMVRIEHVIREVTHRMVAPLFKGKIRANLESSESMEEIWSAARMASATSSASSASTARAWDSAWSAVKVESAACAASTAIVESAAMMESAAWAASAASEASAAWAASAADTWNAAWSSAKSSEAAEHAASAANKAWNTLKAILIEAIDLGAHGEEDPVFTPRCEKLALIERETAA